MVPLSETKDGVYRENSMPLERSMDAHISIEWADGQYFDFVPVVLDWCFKISFFYWNWDLPMPVADDALHDFSAYVGEYNEHGKPAMVLMVDGVHYAVCIQKVESALHKIPHVTYGRLNFSTKRLRVEWDGSVQLKWSGASHSSSRI